MSKHVEIKWFPTNGAAFIIGPQKSEWISMMIILLERGPLVLALDARNTSWEILAIEFHSTCYGVEPADE